MNEQRIQDMLPQSAFVYGVITAVDEDRRMVKIQVQPYDIESGWCRVMKDTFYPIPPHLTHNHHPDPDGEVDPVHGGNQHRHDKHSPHIPKWGYKVNMEVIAGAIQLNGGHTYVILGPLDDGEMDPDEEPLLTTIENDEWGKCL
ncbi:DUF1292 domain-containing protein [Aneurinibacillus terranovensis]|uniref:DUF1292 domain-containing protein n=1 Tax=Aneurinibacillus terranovensis TaxID=278991 RepID=UPI000486C9AF|nr:DUF1292 domain-containing protein [Aneurinibacillus terranovensis]